MHSHHYYVNMKEILSKMFVKSSMEETFISFFKAESLRFLTPANKDGFYVLKITQVLCIHQFNSTYDVLQKNPHFAISKIYVLNVFSNPF